MGGATAIAARGRKQLVAEQPLHEREDAEVVALAREGDHEAFRVLVERHQGRVYRLALRILRDEELARDASQEAFLKAYRSLRRFEGRSAFFTWLYRLVTNQCLDVRRKAQSRREQALPGAGDEDGFAEPPPPDPGLPSVSSEPPPPPDHARERADLRAQIAAVLDELPEEARHTLLLREVDGLSYAEIAKVLGIPKGTVMSRLHYARKRARELLAGAGVAPGGAG